MTQIDQPEWLKGFVPTPRPERPPGAKGNPYWEKGGPSPNPKGRPPGLTAQSKLRQVWTDDLPELGRKTMEAALAGDMTAAGHIYSRMVPSMRSQSDKVQFPFDAEAPMTTQIEQVLAAVAAGEVPPDVAQQIISSIAALNQARLTEELAAEVAALKAKDVTP